MKRKSTLSFFMAIVLVLITILSSCNTVNHADQSVVHLSPFMCGFMLKGITPEEFHETKGKNTILEGKYSHAEVDDDGCLILTLENKVISEWKNSFRVLHILQLVLGDSRDIGIIVDYSMEFMHLMEYAYSCGFEISDDFSRVIQSPGDNDWYYPSIVAACAQMQVFEGKTCSEVCVEFLKVDENGEVIETIIFPEDTENAN